jgi:hypothetical protein
VHLSPFNLRLLTASICYRKMGLHPTRTVHVVFPLAQRAEAQLTAVKLSKRRYYVQVHQNVPSLIGQGKYLAAS